jgi:uncharacterized damage-inducible protein DinB
LANGKRNMITTAYVQKMAAYNQWMNARLYESAGSLPPETVSLDRGAFFGSILGTLHHLVNGDTGWLKRFANSPAHSRSLDPVRQLESPAALDEIRFRELPELLARRTLLDAVIVEWSNELTDGDLGETVAYVNMKGEKHSKQLGALLMHFFNHQTHHRGQATTLLTQAGAEVGITDLLALLPDVEH